MSGHYKDTIFIANNIYFFEGWRGAMYFWIKIKFIQAVLCTTECKIFSISILVYYLKHTTAYIRKPNRVWLSDSTQIRLSNSSRFRMVGPLYIYYIYINIHIQSNFDIRIYSIYGLKYVRISNFNRNNIFIITQPYI
jgi:hypothetical protein